MKEYVKNYKPELKLNPFKNQEDRSKMMSALGQDIVNSIEEKIVIMPISLVSLVLLRHRSGISKGKLVKEVNWLTL